MEPTEIFAWLLRFASLKGMSGTEKSRLAFSSARAGAVVIIAITGIAKVIGLAMYMAGRPPVHRESNARLAIISPNLGEEKHSASAATERRG